jgi:hypothetical protein
MVAHHSYAPALSLLLYTAAAFVAAAPAGSPTYTPSSVATSATASSTVSPASDDPNAPLWGPYSNVRPEAVRGKLGATILGPENVPVELQNPDLLAPPSTDQGQLPSAKWYVSGPRSVKISVTGAYPLVQAIFSEPHAASDWRVGTPTDW